MGVAVKSDFGRTGETNQTRLESPPPMTRAQFTTWSSNPPTLFFRGGVGVEQLVFNRDAGLGTKHSNSDLVPKTWTRTQRPASSIPGSLSKQREDQESQVHCPELSGRTPGCA